MKAFIILCAFLCSVSSPGEKLADMTDLTILSDSSADTTEFYLNNLGSLWNLTGRFDLKLKLATCSLPHALGTVDFDTTIAGIQHPVVVAINSSLDIIGTKAALPCPPHCGGGKLTTTFANWMKTH